MTNYSSSNTALLPIFEEAEVFLEALAGKDAQFTFQTFDDVEVWDEAKQKAVKRMDKNLVRVLHGTLNEHKHALAALNKRGAGVFVAINKTNLEGIKQENILKVRALFVDLDGSPIQPINDLPEDLQPHIIIESSPNRWHAYWLVDNCKLEQFKQLQQALAAKFDGDKAVNNINRVMRLSGFSHNKAESFITRIRTMQDKLYPYSVNKLIVGLGLNNDKKPKSQAAIVAISAIDDKYTPHIKQTIATIATIAEVESTKRLAANDQEAQEEADWHEFLYGKPTEELLYNHLLTCPLCHITFEQYCYEGAKLGKAYDDLLRKDDNARAKREALALRVDRACIKALPKIPF